ncbi:MAG: PhzF family phenazine biosynthesis protein [Anaerolineae bacterium]|nr:PhzF family phenazine biosynthesis protein [Anaerolineae bacterium]
MKIPVFHVDAFSATAFAGNPAAVCLPPEPVSEQWMQAFAAEMALSETAFLTPEKDGYRLRWFTPRVEVQLCGHATLASAFVLWQTGREASDRDIHFYTLSGLLTAHRLHDWIELNFPACPLVTAQAPAGLLESLGVSDPVLISRDDNIYVVELGSEAEVQACQPDFARLAQVNLRSVGITAAGQPPAYDIVSRYFAPSVGVNEDPVTGSIHCRLAPYWAQKLGKNNLVARQASPRGGTLRLRLAQDRVFLAGQAVTVTSGLVEI